MTVRAGRIALLALAMVATIAAAPPPASTQAPLQSTPGKVDPLPDEMVAAAMLGRAMEIESLSERLVALDAVLVELPRPTRFRGMVQAMRGAVLADLGRLPEAHVALEEAHRLVPDNMWTGYTLGHVLVQQQDLVAGATLIAAAVEQSPDVAATTEPGTFVSLFRRLNYQRAYALRDRMMLALVKSGYAARHPGLGSGLAVQAIQTRLAAGDVAGATALLAMITDSDWAMPMIVGKRYQKLWPAIDAWSGGDLHAQRIAALAEAKATFAANPDPDLAAIRSYAVALADTGNVEEAEKRLQAVLADPAKWDADREEAGAITGDVANWQFEAGESEASLRTSQRFLSISPLGRYNYAANVATNQAMRLAVLGRSAEALALLDRIEANAVSDPNFEGAGARLWFDAIRACAAHDGPDEGAARAAMARLGKNAAVNPSARKRALACRGDTAALANQMIEELRNDRTVDEAASRLRTLAVDDRRAVTRSQRTWAAVVRDPEVIKALDAVSRPLPLGYVAAANNWRH